MQCHHQTESSHQKTGIFGQYNGESSAVIQPNPPFKRMKILDSTISTRSEVIVGNIHPSNVKMLII